ncbi:MAG TPA: amidohydrolase family protein [Candidatus Paceibacterota bacterium]|nr:amidohydrolase family protein [Verrucomicrobiota bacterium]HSA12519.1 amidohydrolase family protein [Candidatus Paceibacterota bacterium]
MIIWDVHCHLSGVPGDSPKARTDQLLRYADRVGIERICVFMGMKWSYDPDPADMRRQNDEVIEAVQHRPDRVFGFVYLNPTHLEASLAEMERCVKDGPLVGLKLWVARRCNDSALDPIAKRAAELEAPFLQHAYLKAGGSENLPGESTPDDLAQLARRHPQTAFICAHVGAEWETGIRTLRGCRNVSVDISGSDPTAGLTEMVVEELGAERVLFGSDAGGRSYASQLGKVFGADLPNRTKQLVLAGNMKRMLSPILKRKGVRV